MSSTTLGIRFAASFCRADSIVRTRTARAVSAAWSCWEKRRCPETSACRLSQSERDLDSLSLTKVAIRSFPTLRFGTLMIRSNAAESLGECIMRKYASISLISSRSKNLLPPTYKSVEKLAVQPFCTASRRWREHFQ